MAIVKFVSAQYVKENTAIEENVDDSKLVPYIIKSQDNNKKRKIAIKIKSKSKSIKNFR
jgi:hypothetical protein